MDQKNTAISANSLSGKSNWPVEGLERLGSCPICESPKRTEKHNNLEDRIFYCAPGSWRMMRCSDCGCGYLDPRPDIKTIGRAYASYYTHSQMDFESIDLPRPTGRFAGMKQKLRDAYLMHTYGVGSTSGWKSAKWIVPCLFPLRAQKLGEWLRHVRMPHPGAKLLDIGCGSGEFVRRANKLGWNAMGIDPDPQAVAAAKGAGTNVEIGSLPKTSFSDEEFDAVTLNHVIEHLHDPKQTLREIRRILKPGGCVSLITPNFGSPLHRVMGADWRGLEPPRHLVVFTHDSLAKACREAELTDITARTALPIPRWFLIASLRIRMGLPSEADIGRSLTARERLIARVLTIAAMINCRWGEVIAIVARKPA